MSKIIDIRKKYDEDVNIGKIRKVKGNLLKKNDINWKDIQAIINHKNRLVIVMIGAFYKYADEAVWITDQFRYAGHVVLHYPVESKLINMASKLAEDLGGKNETVNKLIENITTFESDLNEEILSMGDLFFMFNTGDDRIEQPYGDCNPIEDFVDEFREDEYELYENKDLVYLRLNHNYERDETLRIDNEDPCENYINSILNNIRGKQTFPGSIYPTKVVEDMSEFDIKKHIAVSMDEYLYIEYNALRKMMEKDFPEEDFLDIINEMHNGGSYNISEFNEERPTGKYCYTTKFSHKDIPDIPIYFYRFSEELISAHIFLETL